MVLLIIGILLAIAIPTFFSTTKSANKTSAQANLQTALTASDAYFTEANQTFAGIDAAGNQAVSNISAIDTGMGFVSGTNSTGINSISLWTDETTSLVLVGLLGGIEGLLLHHRDEGPEQHRLGRPRHRHLVLGRSQCGPGRLCGLRYGTWYCRYPPEGSYPSA